MDQLNRQLPKSTDGFLTSGKKSLRGVIHMTNITMNHVTFGYDQLGTLLFDDVQLIIDEQWKLGLVGRNGRGKS